LVPLDNRNTRKDDGRMTKGMFSAASYCDKPNQE